jgi:hypothetical protein
MPLRHKQPRDIGESDLQALIGRERERITIDYKQELPGNSDSEKKDFLADVSSFANAAGGDLVYGMKEENGIPTDLCGLQDIDPDAEIQRLEQIIQDGIQPRIDVSTEPISLQSGSYAIVMRIPRSWAGPHMITFQKWNRFYSRNSVGKQLLDVQQIRAAFTLSEHIADRTRDFRIERLSRIIAEETPIPLSGDQRYVLHIVPFGAFDPGTAFDLSMLNQPSHPLYDYLRPPSPLASFGHRYNLDGFLIYGNISYNAPAIFHVYTQLFRNGIIEALDSSLLDRPSKEFPIHELEQRLIGAFPRYLSFQQQFGIQPPFTVMLSLLKVRDFFIKPGEEIYHRIDRDPLLIPEIIVEDFGLAPAKVLKPIFDAVWNALGYPQSQNYDKDGNRVRPRG